MNTFPDIGCKLLQAILMLNMIKHAGCDILLVFYWAKVERPT